MTSVARMCYSADMDEALHFRRRLAVIMRSYGAWMVRGERHFNDFLRRSGTEKEVAWARYLHASERAARMSSRHARLSRRIMQSV